MKMEWISVKDRLPEYQTFCLVVTIANEYGETDMQSYALGILERKRDIESLFINPLLNDMWFLDGALKWVEKEYITHWMPLPEFPEN
jgi:hypothetical protein